MIHVPITLSENFSISRHSEPTRVSIPFSTGVLFNPDNLHLVNDLQVSLPFQYKVLAYWPNGSVKWLQLYFQISLAANTKDCYYLSDLDSSELTYKVMPYSVSVTKNNQHLYIKTGIAEFSLNTSEFGMFTAEKADKTKFTTQNNSVLLTDTQNNLYIPVIKQVEIKKALGNCLEQSIKLTGTFESKEKTPSVTSDLSFEANLTFFAGKAFIKANLTLHNPKSMIHKGGKWDLGNENSFFFNALNLHVEQENLGHIKYQTHSHDDIHTTDIQPFSITQVSSGGKNWHSTNHMNYQGEVTLPFKGYVLNVNNEQQQVIERTTPFITTQNHQHTFSFYIEKFWQNFPTSIDINKNIITLALFPELTHETYELQPGEKKTQSFYLDFAAHSHSDSIVSLGESPIQINICADYLASTHTLPIFSAKDHDQPLNKLVSLGLESENNFFAKREVIDEFGWRNFGDLYADHEALAYKGSKELISHYNNQYDPLYGFLRQYLLTGKKEWLELANDLAQHITDIDIYHTEQDRDEYNGGLFWHTDHYLPAETASHRTYSKRQDANAYQDHAGGGGPGGQHCYTTGLMLHYFITGTEASKAAALTINHWITKVYEGSSTLGDFLLAVKNKNRIDLKNIFTNKYPLDRGTGNYITALLDSFELTGKQSYLDDASLVIKNTVHPQDDITLRDLKNVEECWFYTVFFQAVGRFLQVKETYSQLDESFDYARQVLLHYANWMLNNETPYLDKPEILEYPNHTWAAQDIRKANIFYIASCFATTPEEQNNLYQQGNHFYHYVTSTLAEEPTRDFTRILSILMQNHGAKSFCEERLALQIRIPNNKGKHFLQKEKSPREYLLDAFLKTLSNTSLSLELNWLRKRVAKVDKLLIKLGR